MDKAKLSSALVNHVGLGSKSGMVEVVVELRPAQAAAKSSSLPRSQRMAALKEEFEREITPVEHAIAEAGGRVVNRAWINHTLKAELPISSLEQLTDLPEVSAIDIPRSIEPDSR